MQCNKVWLLTEESTLENWSSRKITITLFCSSHRILLLTNGLNPPSWRRNTFAMCAERRSALKESFVKVSTQFSCCLIISANNHLCTDVVDTDVFIQATHLEYIYPSLMHSLQVLLPYLLQRGGLLQLQTVCYLYLWCPLYGQSSLDRGEPSLQCPVPSVHKGVLQHGLSHWLQVWLVWDIGELEELVWVGRASMEKGY